MVFSHINHVIFFPPEPSIYRVPPGMSQDWQEAELPVGPCCVFLQKLERVMSGQETAGREGPVSWTECLEVAGRNLVLPLSH